MPLDPKTNRDPADWRHAADYCERLAAAADRDEKAMHDERLEEEMAADGEGRWSVSDGGHSERKVAEHYHAHRALALEYRRMAEALERDDEAAVEKLLPYLKMARERAWSGA